MEKIKNTKKVAVLMATYNGEKYLEEQLDSILNQTYKDFTIYIQDDGSSDNTVSIINSYAENYNNIMFINNGLNRLGASLNFMTLLNYVDSEYYMFADQDDFWLTNKIELSINRLINIESQNGKNSPIIVHTDRTYTDQKLNVTQVSEFNPRNRELKDIEYKVEELKNCNILSIYTIVGGCTMAINKKAKEISLPYLNIRMHDATIAMRVAHHEKGIISTIYESTILYRQHESNTCGISNESKFAKLLKIKSVLSNNMMGFYIWKIYHKGSFLKFLKYRMRIFYLQNKY